MFIFLLIIVAIALLIMLRKRQLENFVLANSKAIQALIRINDDTTFEDVPNLDIEHSYDNENFYHDISTLDYLTYQLMYQQKNFLSAINIARSNATKHRAYLLALNNLPSFCLFDAKTLPSSKEHLCTIEQRLFKQRILKPKTVFVVSVCLWRTNIQGRRFEKKCDYFGSDKITDIIEKLNQKQNGFYQNEGIWQSICRVERGKVSNRMRFAVYERDGYRCKKCGKRSAALEVDHIYPISKGGKSTFDNLQALCHDCNIKKSNRIEPGVISPRYGRNVIVELCPNCNVNLVLKKSRYGEFYGCPNYPRCRYTKR